MRNAAIRHLEYEFDYGMWNYAISHVSKLKS